MVNGLADFCASNDLPWNDGTESSFQTYLDLLTHFNQSMNLIGPMDEADLVDQLVIDSVAAAAVCAPAGSILDVGTGAGLPGIPLKLLYPACPITLVEPRRKRATFLKIATTRLGLEGVDLQRERIENVASARYDYVISKAFQPPIEWLETASGWVSDEGVAVCMTRCAERGALEERAEDLGLQLVAGCDDTRELGAPDVGESRAIYVFGS